MDKVFDIQEEMRNCKVVKNIGESISFEMFDESSNTFILACVVGYTLSDGFAFIKQQNCHKKSLVEISDKNIIARMTIDWLSGLIFTLTCCSNDQTLAMIRFVKR
jgi:hypothetical protein